MGRIEKPQTAHSMNITYNTKLTMEPLNKAHKDSLETSRKLAWYREKFRVSRYLVIDFLISPFLKLALKLQDVGFYG